MVAYSSSPTSKHNVTPLASYKRHSRPKFDDDTSGAIVVRASDPIASPSLPPPPPPPQPSPEKVDSGRSSPIRHSLLPRPGPRVEKNATPKPPSEPKPSSPIRHSLVPVLAPRVKPDVVNIELEEKTETPLPVTSASSGGANVEKYRKMMRIGLSHEAVRHAMAKDGVPTSLIPELQ